MQKLFSSVLLIAVLGALAYAGVMLLQQHQRAKANETKQLIDIPSQIAPLHRQALEGTIQLQPPEEMVSVFTNAGFPNQRPMLNLKPRALLSSAAMIQVDRWFVSLAHYQLDSASNRRFSIFMLPIKSDFAPTSLGTMQVQGRSMYASSTDGFNVILWKHGNWYVAMVTDLTGKEMNDVLGVVLSVDSKY